MNKHIARLSKLISAVLILCIAIEVINIFHKPKVNLEVNSFLVDEDSLPMISAHRGGGLNNPENTMMAFRSAVVEYGAQVLECDLYLTEDGYLVFNHDPYIDLTCNVNGDITKEEVEQLCEDEANRHYIRDMTLEELRQDNCGYYFEDENGERIHKDKDPELNGLQITTVDQLFNEFYYNNPAHELLYILEIKEDGERGIQACRTLNEMIEMFNSFTPINAKQRVVVSSYHAEIEDELRLNYPELYRGASTDSATSFILTQLLRVNFLDKSDFACLQIPTTYDVKGISINLARKTIIRQAHRRGIAVQYWTVNDEDEMRMLIELGCDCITTDDPALLQSVLQEYRNS